MTEGSDTESCELEGRPSRNPAAQEEVGPTDSHERVRRVVQRERDDRRVLAASEFVIAAAERIGFVDTGGEIPRQVRQLRWSVFNVPLMWAAAAGEEERAVLGWMSAQAENLPHITVDGESVQARKALRAGWECATRFVRGTSDQGKTWRNGYTSKVLFGVILNKCGFTPCDTMPFFVPKPTFPRKTGPTFTPYGILAFLGPLLPVPIDFPQCHSQP